MLRRAALGLSRASLGEQAFALVRLSLDPNPTNALALAHCELATTLAARLGVPERVIGALAQIYERYDGRGEPNGLPQTQDH